MRRAMLLFFSFCWIGVMYIPIANAPTTIIPTAKRIHSFHGDDRSMCALSMLSAAEEFDLSPPVLPAFIIATCSLRAVIASALSVASAGIARPILSASSGMSATRHSSSSSSVATFSVTLARGTSLNRAAILARRLVILRMSGMKTRKKMPMSTARNAASSPYICEFCDDDSLSYCVSPSSVSALVPRAMPSPLSSRYRTSGRNSMPTGSVIATVYGIPERARRCISMSIDACMAVTFSATFGAVGFETDWVRIRGMERPLATMYPMISVSNLSTSFTIVASVLLYVDSLRMATARSRSRVLSVSCAADLRGRVAVFKSCRRSVPESRHLQAHNVPGNNECKKGEGAQSAFDALVDGGFFQPLLYALPTKALRVLLA
eukprot:Opistho-2@79569